MVTDDENSTELEETTSFDGESSSCFFSEEEIDNCLDSPHIEYNFTDLKKIGAGGFGSVYEAVHTIEDKKYALKFVKIFSLDFDKREVKILASLNHPNVLRYYTSWITPFRKWSSCSEGSGKENSESIVSFEKEIPPSEKNNAVVSTDSKSKNSKNSEFIYDACLVIQTELCNPNKNLEILIHEGEIFTMSDKKRLNLFLDIVSGLKYMHSKGIMHRDLKPSNILLDIDNRAKIGDFGFARKCKLSPAGKTSENEFSQNVGTCLYVAPEVRDSNIYDKNADIYSLGMILFEMYHKMGSGMERIKIMEKLRNQEFSDLKNIPAKFINVRCLVKSLLSHDPTLRKTLKRIKKLMSPLEPQQVFRMIKLKFEDENLTINTATVRIIQKIMESLCLTLKFEDENTATVIIQKIMESFCFTPFYSHDQGIINRHYGFYRGKEIDSRLVLRTMGMMEPTHKCCDVLS
nr:eukaryotic translation initiation factor 2-alpha kinase 3-like isoform X4 [Crassostrea gigas]